MLKFRQSHPQNDRLQIYNSMYECAHSFITYNNLNIPSYDVHSVQARDQMLVNLYKLQQSFVKINNTITEKTKQQNQRIDKIRQRIANCVNKIQQLEGINKAICFVSPGEYPTKYKFDPEGNVSIFKDFIQRTKVNKFDLQAHYQMKHEIEKAGNSSKLELDNLYKFVLYLYGKLKCKKMSSLESSIACKKVLANNLGRIPTTIRYVDSLSIFDTYINPYKNYEIAPRKVVKKQKSKPQQEPAQQIISITTYTKPSYYMEKPDYKPVAQQIDDILLDEDLALDGVVDIDIDDFLSGMSTTGVVEKKVLQDPYKQSNPDANSSAGFQQNNNAPNLAPPPSFSSNYNQSSSTLPPPPPSLSNLSLPPPPPSLGNLSLPPPPPSLPLGGILPPPPSLGLPPPPPLGNLLPPPPTLNLPIPAPAMPAPSFGSSGGGDRSGLLKQLNQPNPILRLKKTVTKQTPNIINLNAPPVQSNGEPGGQSRPMSHADALRLKIMNRFKALHPEKESSDQD